MLNQLPTLRGSWVCVADGPEVDGQALAQQLGLSLSTIPPKFSQIRKRYNLNIKVVNTAAIRQSGNSVGGVVQPAHSSSDVGDEDDLTNASSVSSNHQHPSM